MLTNHQSIASFNGDLSSLTAPAFILSTQSLVEFSAYWTENIPLFIAPTQEPDPAKRALLVLKWLLNTLKQQYCSRSEKLGSEKKPLNPFLGELFLGHWDEEQYGKTHLVSEQVSHHPPVTAYCIWNDKHNIRLQGYNGQKASFSRTIHVKQIGHALLTLTPPNSSEPETYLITLPALHIENLIYGSPFVELEKLTHIASSTGFVGKIDYSGRGWFSGKKNTFTASLWQDGKGSEKSPLYTVDGQWSDAFSIKEGSGGKLSKEIGNFQPADVKLSKLVVAPLEEQDVIESRRAWAKVSRSIEKGDMDAVSHHKSTIENAQRALRKDETAHKREWQRAFFTRLEDAEHTESEATFQRLVKMVSHVAGIGGWDGVAADKTGGVWRFDQEKASKAQRPYHEEGLRCLGEREDGSTEPNTPIERVRTNQSGLESPTVGR